MTYCLVSLGCQMNASDSERVSAVLESMGYLRTEYEEEADLLGLVACSVRQRAIDRAYGRIKKWNEWKRQRNILTFATGCVLPADRERFVDLFDLFFPVDELSALPDMIRNSGVVTEASARFADSSSTEGASSGTAHWRIAPVYASTFDAWVPIQNGCDKYCSFCAVPYTRGREVSRRSDEILDEVSRLVDSGYRSITLLGQNVNSYGQDRKGGETSFAGLLERIGEIGRTTGHRFLTYFTSPHPADMRREVFEVIAAYPVLAKQIHLPIQSGDDEVLHRMNRSYRLDRYREVVADIRELLPGATLFTDIIVGFPGETVEQFEHTRAALLEFRYHMAYIAMYSPRPGAKSFRWEDDVPHEEKRRRLHVLSDELKAISLDHNRRLVGTIQSVLVSGRDRDERYLSGRNEGKTIVRFAAAPGASSAEGDSMIGSFVDVRITSAADLSVEGELVG